MDSSILQGQGCFSRQQRFFKIQFVSRNPIPSVNSTAERTVPFSSLTLPLHGWASILFLASASKPFTSFSNSSLASCRKKSANGIMSSLHSHNGGMCRVYSFNRWYKSARKRFSAMAVSKFSLVAAMMRTSAFLSLLPPVGLYRLASSARSSICCTSSDRLPISSRNNVPPAASSQKPCFLRVSSR